MLSLAQQNEMHCPLFSNLQTLWVIAGLKSGMNLKSCRRLKALFPALQGVAGLYKGILPNLAKVAPAAGISWVVFEEVKLFLGVDPKS